MLRFSEGQENSLFVMFLASKFIRFLERFIIKYSTIEVVLWSHLLFDGSNA